MFEVLIVLGVLFLMALFVYGGGIFDFLKTAVDEQVAEAVQKEMPPVDIEQLAKLKKGNLVVAAKEFFDIEISDKQTKAQMIEELKGKLNDR
jgi:hypothetical protein